MFLHLLSNTIIFYPAYSNFVFIGLFLAFETCCIVILFESGIPALCRSFAGARARRTRLASSSSLRSTFALSGPCWSFMKTVLTMDAIQGDPFFSAHSNHERKNWRKRDNNPLPTYPQSMNMNNMGNMGMNIGMGPGVGMGQVTTITLVV